tara:strand:- start:2738 stop:3229 length:492 start_codon:yes stop_codon:yes gene_type:complete
MAKFGFDVDEVEVDIAPDYSPIPKGEYKLQALEAEEKETAKKNGSYIKVKFEVVDGPHMSRLIWQNFNIVNPNEIAQRIGRQQLVAWATACGKPDAADTDLLIGKTFAAAVDIDKGTGGYSDSNTIKGFLQSKAHKNVEKVSAPAAVEAPVAPAAKSGSNPWD